METPPHDAVTARKLVSGLDTSFGSKYRWMVRKGLESDFVLDCTDLQNGKVQTAVYNNVPWELESIRKDFEKIMGRV